MCYQICPINGLADRLGGTGSRETSVLPRVRESVRHARALRSGTSPSCFLRVVVLFLRHYVPLVLESPSGKHVCCGYNATPFEYNLSENITNNPKHVHGLHFDEASVCSSRASNSEQASPPAIHNTSIKNEAGAKCMLAQSHHICGGQYLKTS